MKRNVLRSALLFLSLGVIVLLSQPALTLSLEGKGNVSRPFKVAAHSQMVVNLVDYSFTAEAWGNATHFGKVTMAGWGNLTQPVGFGTITAANGDLVEFEHNMQTNMVTITGGTGRFEGAAGEFILVTQLVSQVIDPVAGTMTMQFVWTGSGTISY